MIHGVIGLRRGRRTAGRATPARRPAGGRRGTGRGRGARWHGPDDDAAQESPGESPGRVMRCARNQICGRDARISPGGTQPPGFALSHEFNDMRLLCSHACREEKRILCHPP
jgi:hypothetical protein